MTTADILMERALALASQEIETEQAVQELLAASGDRRVAVVMARRHLLDRQEEDHDAQIGRAADLLQEVLTRLPED